MTPSSDRPTRSACGRRYCEGRWIATRVPAPGAETTSIRPPAASTRTRCDASPMWPSASRSASCSIGKPRPSSSTTSSSSSVGLDEAKCHLGRLRVPNDVRQQLTGRREDELLLRMAGRVVQDRASAPGARDSRPVGRSNGAPPRVRPPRARRGGGRRRLRAAARPSRRARCRRGPARGARAVSPASSSSWRAESRFWIAWSWSASASALRSRCSAASASESRRDRVLGEPGDELRSPGEQHREEHAGDPDPGEVPGLRDDEAHRLGLRRGGMRARLDDVGGRRHDRRRRR